MMEGETAAGEHLSLREFADDNQESAVGSTEASGKGQYLCRCWKSLFAVQISIR